MFIFLLNKLRRSFNARFKRLKIKIKYIFFLRLPSNLNLELYKSAELASIPGSSKIFTHLEYFSCINNLEHFNKTLFKHQLKIFSDTLIDINYQYDSIKIKQKIINIFPEFDIKIINTYNPIDWHTDFYSGYTWDSNQFYQDVKMAPLNGVEIKVPRELSRFQHISCLYKDEYDKTGPNEFQLQVADWIIQNPLGKGVNWASNMDVSLRAINWIYGLRIFEKHIKSQIVFQNLVANSLRDHGKHILENLDFNDNNYPTGNHYLAEITGLIYIGATMPDIPESDTWLIFGINQLISEMNRQVLEDGMSHEASTSYHRLVTELFLCSSVLIEKIPLKRRLRLLNSKYFKISDMYNFNFSENISDSFNNSHILPLNFYNRLNLMGEFTTWMTKPNGLIFQLGDNDSARVHKLLPYFCSNNLDHKHIIASIGKLFNRVDLLQFCDLNSDIESSMLIENSIINNLEYKPIQKSSNSYKLFPKSGVAVVKKENAWLGVSCGNSGQYGLGGHGHNDKNSFELNVNNFDIIVDGGCPYYTSYLNIRNDFRSTFAHNTIGLIGKEQNSFDKNLSGVCRLVENANPQLTINEQGLIIGKHSGYINEHIRIFELNDNSLIIEDFFADEEDNYLIFNFHPDVMCSKALVQGYNTSFILSHKNDFVVNLTLYGVSDFEIKPGFYSTGYGRITENLILKIKRTTFQTKSIFEWH